ncbi:hypothetical protein MLD38_039337 [Melastoma candidum]|uniref:Uncharacterized protein n=1 Tax=Melastoma candidum TaxID=119954 RepID=A0ACB9L2M7_9MYRT|nr:hypothetical protein MLD38_039337 [Melastoma candidum]
MAVQDANPASIPSAEVVGNAFVEQYYHILHQSPGMVHRFYQDSSLLSRPDANGVMSTVTTVQAINEKIESLNYEEYTVKIKTVDAQRSHEKGVIVIVTGCLTGKDNARRKFTQTFFLAPQDNGYFVLNDVLRYIGESEPLNAATNASDYEWFVDEDAAIEPIHPKKSYASIVKVMQGLKVSRPVHAPSDKTEVGSANNVQQSIRPTSPKPEGPAAAKSGSAGAPAPANDSMPESSNANEEVEGYPIYVRNLPINATVEQLDKAFQRFGSIKPNGIQVRNAKQGSCFGFVEFEALVSMQSALQASPITIGHRPAVIEEKRTTTRASIHVPGPVIVEPIAGLEEEDLNDGWDVCDSSDYEWSVDEDAAIEPIHPKKSYASIQPIPKQVVRFRKKKKKKKKKKKGADNSRGRCDS